MVSALGVASQPCPCPISPWLRSVVSVQPALLLAARRDPWTPLAPERPWKTTKDYRPRIVDLFDCAELPGWRFRHSRQWFQRILERGHRQVCQPLAVCFGVVPRPLCPPVLRACWVGPLLSQFRPGLPHYRPLLVALASLASCSRLPHLVRPRGHCPSSYAVAVASSVPILLEARLPLRLRNPSFSAVGLASSVLKPLLVTLLLSLDFFVGVLAFSVPQAHRPFPQPQSCHSARRVGISSWVFVLCRDPARSRRLRTRLRRDRVFASG